MDRPRRRRLRWVGRSAAALVLGSLLLVLGASAASAHAKVLGTSPADAQGYRSGEGPRTAVVTFDEPVDAPAGFLKLYGGTGRAIAGQIARAQHSSRVEAALPSLRDGTYVAVWHVVSDDGHPVAGVFTFTVGRPAGIATNVNALLASSRASWELGFAFGLDRFLAYCGGLVLVGGLIYLRLAWPEALTHRRVRGFLVGSACVAVTASLASIPLEAAYSTARASNLFTGAALSRVVDMRFGTAALWRCALLALLVLAIGLLVGRAWTAKRVVLELLVVTLGMAVLASFAYAGHGDTGRLVPLGFTSDIVHLAAASAWLGGIAALAVASRAGGPAEESTLVAARFSKIALPAIFLVVLSGSIQGWRQVGSWHALWHTTYGRLLILKVGVVAGIVIIASASRDVVRSRVVPATLGALRRQQPSIAGDAPPGRELRNGIWAEVLLAVGVLAVTANLAFTAPGREAVASAQAGGDVLVSTNTHSFEYQVIVEPAITGLNTIVIAPTSLHKDQLLPASLTATLERSGRRSEPILFAALPDGRFLASVDLTRDPARLAFTASDGTTSDRAEVTLRVR
jgi:copper transport protein